ncbi:hypothetical protein AAF712_011875 [Marasmius tenuissimus]|uniref:Uncharacterized protein n=1 Tax=Marasmius tenuissimus TaxID=585030 RepID=A0ABR2ZK05_9AGAR|nr:hypothetical protein PM082_009293 [Marasmius tenuissimus]
MVQLQESKSGSSSSHEPSEQAHSEEHDEQTNENEQPQESEDQVPPPPQSSRLKRVFLLLLIGALVWRAFFSKDAWFGKKEPQVVHAKRYSKEFKYRPAASPIITETMKDGRLRVRGAEPTTSTAPKPTPVVKKKKRSTGAKKGKRAKQRVKKSSGRDEF